MDRLRPRNRPVFSGFTRTESEKMEKLLKELGDCSLEQDCCRRIAQNFNRSSGRAGKPVVRWTEIQSWFQSRLQELTQDNKNGCPPVEELMSSPLPKEAGEKIKSLSELEFEARSSKDGAWYDVEMFLAHRYISTGETEVRARFVGFGAEEDEWVNIKQAVRVRSVPIEPSECDTVKVGDLVLCFQERRDQAIYYDARVIEIQRKMHDIRGCRCLFLIRYEHDRTEERVRLRRLCGRPAC